MERRRGALLSGALGGMAILGLVFAGCQQFGPGDYAQTDDFNAKETAQAAETSSYQPNRLPPNLTGPAATDRPVRSNIRQVAMRPQDAALAGPGPAPGPGAPRPLQTGPMDMGGMPMGGDFSGPAGPPRLPLPRELNKTTLPPYRIEPPDILFIDAIRIVPKPPYRIEAMDVLLINVAETLPNQPISGPFNVAPDGTVNLGYSYGVVRVAGYTLEEAARAMQTHLRRALRDPQVAVALASFRGVQQTRGEHLVTPDGTLNLGTYGSVNVVGLTIAEAKAKIEHHLAQWLQDPVISLSVVGYNSKVYYVVIDGGGYGQQVFRLPITGNETVLDAIGMINGLPPVSSKKKIWLARPTPDCNGCYEILPIYWQAIVAAGDTSTNYQLLPGDRIYVKANCLLAINNRVTQTLLPYENVAGATLLGVGTANGFRFLTSGIGLGGIR